MKKMSIRRSHHQQSKYEKLLDVSKIESDGNMPINDWSLRSPNIKEPSELPPSSRVLPPPSPSTSPSSCVLPPSSPPIPRKSIEKMVDKQEPSKLPPPSPSMPSKLPPPSPMPSNLPSPSLVMPSQSPSTPRRSTVGGVINKNTAFGFFDGIGMRNGNVLIDDKLLHSSNIEKSSKLPPPSPTTARKSIIKPISRAIKSHTSFSLFNGRDKRNENTSVDDQLLYSSNIEEPSKLPPPSPATSRKSSVKPIGRVIKSHPLFGFFDGSNKKAVTKPDFGRYLEYVKEGGAWDTNSNKPVMFYK